MANDFRWFDTPGKELLSPSNQGDPRVVGYQPSKRGALSILGQTLAGIGHTFGSAYGTGDPMYFQKTQAMYNDEVQAEMEFQAQLMRQRAVDLENESQKRLRDAQTNYYLGQAELVNNPEKFDQYIQAINNNSGTMLPSPGTTLLPGQMPLPGQAPAPAVQQEQKQPTLKDAFVIDTPKMIYKKSVTSTGKPQISQIINPDYAKELERVNKSSAELGDFFDSTEKLSVVLNELEKSIQAIPKEYRAENMKLGPLNKLGGKMAMGYADMSNQKWFRDYQQSLNNSFMPIAQSEGLSKVLSDLDLTTQVKALGSEDSPIYTKERAIQIIKDKIKSSSVSKLKAAGAREDIVSSLYPNTANTFGLTSGKQSENLNVQFPSSFTPEQIKRYQELKKKAGK